MSSKEKLASKDELKRKLTPAQYEICINRGTERAFSGKYHDCKVTSLLHDIIIWSWAVGFTTATLLAIGIASYQNYKKYVKQIRIHDASHNKYSEQTDDEIKKWKRRVFRP